MENIINKIIELDASAKNKILKIKEKEDNIETYISEQIEKEKEVIDSRFLFKKKKMQEKYDEMFEKRKTEIDNDKNEQIQQLKAKYEIEREKIINKVIEEIIWKRTENENSGSKISKS